MPLERLLSLVEVGTPNAMAEVERMPGMSMLVD